VAVAVVAAVAVAEGWEVWVPVPVGPLFCQFGVYDTLGLEDIPSGGRCARGNTRGSGRITELFLDALTHAHKEVENIYIRAVAPRTSGQALVGSDGLWPCRAICCVSCGRGRGTMGTNTGSSTQPATHSTVLQSSTHWASSLMGALGGGVFWAAAKAACSGRRRRRGSGSGRCW